MQIHAYNTQRKYEIKQRKDNWPSSERASRKVRSSWVAEEAATAAVVKAFFSSSISALDEQKTEKRNLRQFFTAIDSTLVVEQEAIAGEEEDTFEILGTVAVEVKNLEEGTERIAIVVEIERDRESGGH